MGILAITSPGANDTFTATVLKQGEPPLTNIRVSGTCASGAHDVTVSIYNYPKNDGAQPVESATANGQSWGTALMNIGVGQYQIEASCSDGRGGTVSAKVAPVTVQQ